MAFSMALSGCQTGGEKETAGTLIGAAGGAIIGSQIGGGSGKVAAVALGALGGGYIGKKVGKSMDDSDRRERIEAQRPLTVREREDQLRREREILRQRQLDLDRQRELDRQRRNYRYY